MANSDDEEVNLTIRYKGEVHSIFDVPMDISNSELFQLFLSDICSPRLRLPGKREINLTRPKYTMKKYLKKVGMEGETLRGVFEMDDAKDEGGGSSEDTEKLKEELETARKKGEKVETLENEVEKLRDEVAVKEKRISVLEKKLAKKYEEMKKKDQKNANLDQLLLKQAEEVRKLVAKNAEMEKQVKKLKEVNASVRMSPPKKVQKTIQKVAPVREPVWQDNGKRSISGVKSTPGYTIWKGPRIRMSGVTKIELRCSVATLQSSNGIRIGIIPMSNRETRIGEHANSGVIVYFGDCGVYVKYKGTKYEKGNQKIYAKNGVYKVHITVDYNRNKVDFQFISTSQKKFGRPKKYEHSCPYYLKGNEQHCLAFGLWSMKATVDIVKFEEM